MYTVYVHIYVIKFGKLKFNFKSYQLALQG